MKKILTIVAILVMLLLVMAPATYAAPPAWGGGGNSYHTVQWGETLFSIGRLYGVNPYQIAQVNGLYNPNYIYAGQVLYIPSGGGWDGGCGNSGCNYNGGYNGGYYGGCGNSGCNYNGGYYGNYNGGYYGGCGNSGCTNPRPYCPSGCSGNVYGCDGCQNQRWGYDNTGYYYENYNPNYQRYSYTCGYYHNCYRW